MSDIKNNDDDHGNDYLEGMKKSLGASAVLKIRLASLRASAPDMPILAFEGPEDKIIYYSWISRIRGDLRYEPFPCGGKDGVLSLRRMVRRDLNNLGEGVFFFVDRDFDDLRGEEPSDDLFMTDQYSVENYLVTEDVLNELLKNEFHCHDGPGERAAAIELFRKAYTEFLTVTREVNYRLFVARRLKLELQDRLPDRVGPLAIVQLDGAVTAGRPCGEIVQLETEPSAADLDLFEQEFNDLSPPARYRGKFNLMFFMRWLTHLVNDRASEESRCFTIPLGDIKVNINLISLLALAAKSSLPIGLAEFVGRVAVPNA